MRLLELLVDWQTGLMYLQEVGLGECVSVISVSHCRSVRLEELLFCFQQMVHLAPSNCDPLDRLGRSPVRCEEDQMTVSTSESEVTLLSWKTVDFSLLIGI